MMCIIIYGVLLLDTKGKMMNASLLEWTSITFQDSIGYLFRRVGGSIMGMGLSRWERLEVVKRTIILIYVSSIQQMNTITVGHHILFMYVLPNSSILIWRWCLLTAMIQIVQSKPPGCWVKFRRFLELIYRKISNKHSNILGVLARPQISLKVSIVCRHYLKMSCWSSAIDRIVQQ
jgi:hypothetical protein